MVTSGTRRYSLGFSTNDRRAMSYLELYKINWGETPIPLLSILHKHKSRLCKSNQSLVPYLHSTNQHILLLYTFPWHNRQTLFSSGSSRKHSLYLLLLLPSSLWEDWSTISVLLIFSWSSICWCLPKRTGIFCCFQLSLPIEFIGDWMPKVLWSLSMQVEENWNQVKSVLWFWVSQRQLPQIPWPFVPEATQLGKWIKEQFHCRSNNVWAELSWVSELQWLKISSENRIWWKPR